VRFSHRMYFGRLADVVFVFLAITFALGCSGAPAQQQIPSAKALELLARIGCETGTVLAGNVDIDTGYIAMLGVSQKTYSFRVLDNGPHTLMISAEQCGDSRPLAQKTFHFILSHSFQNRQQVRESYYYLMNQRGQLLNAVHFQEGRSRRYVFAGLAIPVRRADFEAEKAIWIAMVSALPEAQRGKPGAE
jgi:hypothetical protein